MAETARTWIRPGFRVREGMAEELAEYHDDIEAPEEAKSAAARRIVDAEWEERLRVQESWSTPGDYDRLRNAFAALEADGFVCRMNFTCCQTCGTAEIDDERAALAEGDYPFREWAYTFFHQQDAERLTDEGAHLFLTYSAWRAAPGIDPELRDRARAGDEEARHEVVRRTDAAVGEKVAAALRDAGLTVTWDGDPGTRIAVADLDWRKPLPVSS